MFLKVMVVRWREKERRERGGGGGGCCWQQWPLVVLPAAEDVWRPLVGEVNVVFFLLFCCFRFFGGVRERVVCHDVLFCVFLCFLGCW